MRFRQLAMVLAIVCLVSTPVLIFSDSDLDADPTDYKTVYLVVTSGKEVILAPYEFQVSYFDYSDYGYGDLNVNIAGNMIGKTTVMHAFIKAHANEFPDVENLSDVFKVSDDGWIHSFWNIAGTDPGVFGDDIRDIFYIMNGRMTNVAQNEEVLNGSLLQLGFFRYASMTDRDTNISFTEQKIVAYSGEETTFSLCYTDLGAGLDDGNQEYNLPLDDISVYQINSDASLDYLGKTDSQGEIDLSFAEPGTYWVGAHKEGTTMAVARVIVPSTSAGEIHLDKTSHTMSPGEKVTLNVSAAQEDADLRNMVWSSGDENVASVDQNGNVTAKGVGTAKIYATSPEGYVAECTITVKNSQGSGSGGGGNPVLYVGAGTGIAVVAAVLLMLHIRKR